MKVVLFCGGLGTRLREHSETIPKPLVNVGRRPIIWHLMKYYAHFGHKDFILCLGHYGELIKEYFVNYSDWVSSDFTLTGGGQTIDLARSDIQSWRITFVDTGIHANIGERLLAVRGHLADEEHFLANYSDALSDLPLPDYLNACEKHDTVASMVAVKTRQSFHVVDSADNGLVTRIAPMRDADIWFNAGFFRFRKDIFEHLNPGEELVEEPFRRLVEARQLFSYRHHGFWAAMDTLKDKITFDQLDDQGHRPWQVWD